MQKNRATRAIVALAAAAALFGLASCAGGAGGGTTKYNVTIGTIAGGTITSDIATAVEGTTVTLTVTPNAGLHLVADSLKVNNGDVAVSGSAPTYSFAMPAGDAKVTAIIDNSLLINFENGSTANVTSSPGYQNDMTGPFSVTAEAAQSDTGYKVITVGGVADSENKVTVSDWIASGLTLGAKDLAFGYGSKPSAPDGHVVLSFKNLSYGNLADKSGIEFTIKMPSIPPAGAIGIMPHIRYNSDGTHENAVVFAREYYAWPLSDDAFFTIKIPFASLTKPGYSDVNSYSTFADAIAANVAFNQLDFDLRFIVGTTGEENTPYTGYIDNIQLY